MFEFRRIRTGDLSSICIENHKTGIGMQILPDHGSRLTRLGLGSSGSRLSCICGISCMDEILNDRLFKSAVMIPFPNRIRDGKYLFEGREYELRCNFPKQNHAIHGLIYDQPFHQVSCELASDGAEIVFRYTADKGFPGYPFRFETFMTYRLNATGKFALEMKIRNLSEGIIPMGAGWHPYLTMHRPVDDLLMKIPCVNRLICDERQIPTGRKSRWTDFQTVAPIGDLQMDDCFEIQDLPGEVCIELQDPKNGFRVLFKIECGLKAYRYFQLYIPRDRFSMAIEPMTCAPDAFNNREGLLQMQPGESVCTSCTIEFQAP